MGQDLHPHSAYKIENIVKTLEYLIMHLEHFVIPFRSFAKIIGQTLTHARLGMYRKQNSISFSLKLLENGWEAI